MSTLFSVVAGVDDIILDEGIGCGQRAPPPIGRVRSGKRGLYWVEKNWVPSLPATRAPRAPLRPHWPRRHRIFQIAGELEGGVAVVHLEGERLCGGVGLHYRHLGVPKGEYRTGLRDGQGRPGPRCLAGNPANAELCGILTPRVPAPRRRCKGGRKGRPYGSHPQTYTPHNRGR